MRRLLVAVALLFVARAAQAQCMDECMAMGDRACASDTEFTLCGDFDADPCLEESVPTACSVGETCGGGLCRSCGNIGQACCPTLPRCASDATCVSGQCVMAGEGELCSPRASTSAS